MEQTIIPIVSWLTCMFFLILQLCQWITVCLFVCVYFLASRTKTLGSKDFSRPTLTQPLSWGAASNITSSTVWKGLTKDRTSSGHWPPPKTTTFSSHSHNRYPYLGQYKNVNTMNCFLRSLRVQTGENNAFGIILMHQIKFCDRS